uniref:Uncharacterized protein n=1 Tax=Tetranychus urticae TaxID=32264 RepID=T1KRB4_TETUR
MANNCQLWLTTIVLTAIVLFNSVHVEAGKKKDKGLIIVLSNGGCGGNIVVQTAKDGKKGGGGHKIVVKGGDSGGGCGCSNSCGSCGGGGDHHHVQHVPVPVPVPPGHPIPPMGHPEMHAAMMSQLVPAFSADDPHQSSGSSGDSGDQDSQASDSATSATSSDDTSKDSGDSSSDSASSSAAEKAKMVAPLFIPMNAITPPWFHGSPGEFAQSSNVAPTFNDPMFNLHGPGSNFMAPPMGFQGFDENPLLSQPASDSNKKDPSEANKTQGSRGGRSGYLQPLIDSVQRLLRGPSPLREIEQGLVRQGQRMQASFSNLVPVAITNYTSYLPSLPGLRSSSGNRDRL